MTEASPTGLPPLPLPSGIIQTYVKTNDLTYHVLSAGVPGSPLILCLHGFLDLAWSWHEVMPILVSGGYHVIAYDQRGYGRTTGWDTRAWAEVDLHTFSFSRLVTDAVRLVAALGYKEVTMVLGHDLGSMVANLCALIRPDIFKSVITVSRPNDATPPFPFNTNSPPAPLPPVGKALASLPEPRKHVAQYYCSEFADTELTMPLEDIGPFLRQYFFIKSHAWPGNQDPPPYPLSSSEVEQLALLPQYLILPLESDLKAVLSSLMTSTKHDLATAEKLTLPFLPTSDLDVITQEFTRTGFQGALNWYRVLSSPSLIGELQLFAGRKVEVPAIFVGGDSDWSMYERPGVLEGLGEGHRRWYGVRVLKNCGAAPQWERPEELSAVALTFLGDIRDRVVGVGEVRMGLGLGLGLGVGLRDEDGFLDTGPGTIMGGRKRGRDEEDETAAKSDSKAKAKDEGKVVIKHKSLQRHVLTSLPRGEKETKNRRFGRLLMRRDI